MNLAWIDSLIIFAYIAVSLFIGFWVSKKASQNMKSYFLGGNKLSWYTLGLSNASGQFDISGTMLMVYWLFIYGLKSVFLPWLWPAFNQIFLMVFLSIWLRRSGVMTGAQWISFRFGKGPGAQLSHLIVVAFALCLVISFLAYGFIGIGKFAAVFLPWQLSADAYWNEVYYAAIITSITTLYVVKGGMYAVVFTEVMQFAMMTLACVAVGIIAIVQVSPDMIQAAVPQGWLTLKFGWQLDLDWSGILPAANQNIINDGLSLFSVFFAMVLLRGILVSLAGPAPNYDMQRILSARTPVEAAKMSGFVNVVLLVPRYMLITGLTVLALAFFMDQLQAMGPDVDFEQILPFAIKNYVPTGLMGLLIAGLLAAFMSTFAATTNAAPAYIVNDIYKRYINPHAATATYVKLSYIVCIAFVVLGAGIGLFVPSLNNIVLWIVGALFGGYTAANILKWYWWRFNSYGFFFGMLTGILFAIPMMFINVSELYLFPLLLLVCSLACVLGSLLTPPDDMAVLKNFYFKTRPWGFWQPVYLELKKDYPDLQKNTDALRDTVNVAVGIVWHSALTSIGILLVLQQWFALAIALVVCAFASVFLKINWYNRLENYADDESAVISAD
nr:Na+:solute symporter [Cellvibrionaceae bacterium]